MKRFIPILLFVASTAHAQVFIAQSEPTAALRRIPVVLVQAADGFTPQTGVTIAAGECKLSKNGAAEANCTGTLTEIAGGLYYYELDDSPAEADTIGYVSVRIADAAARQFVGVANVGLSDAAFWAKAFNTNTGTNKAAAVAGSVVSEIATNANVKTMDADVISAAAISAAAVTKIQTGIGSSGPRVD